MGYWNGPRSVYYQCSVCGREVLFSSVEVMGRLGESFTCHHTCDCTPGKVFERQFQTDEDAIRRLLGKLRPTLPYRAAPQRFVPMDPERERDIRVFGWECMMLRDVDEFLLFCSRPRP